MNSSIAKTLLVLIVITVFFSLPGQACAVTSPQSEETANAAARLHTLSIPFVENYGQTHPDVRFYAQTFGGTLFVTRDGKLVYALPAKDEKTRDRLTLKEELIGGTVLMPRGNEKSPTRIHYFKGSDPGKWHTHLPTYNSVTLGEVYDGIQVLLRAYGNNVEKIFRIRPRSDPGVIRMKVHGAGLLSINSEGELVAYTKKGEIAFTRPVAYQLLNGKRQAVDVAYELRENTYSFKVGLYDPERELIIDPLLSTYLGGTQDDEATSIATNIIAGKRYIYVAGSTMSNDFPGIAMYQTHQGYNQDAFIALIDMDFTAVQFTYLGGSGEDIIYDLAIRRPDGAVYIVGTTDGHFPVTIYNTRGDNEDAFVARLSFDLSTLEKSRYFGGSLKDNGIAITLYDDESADPLDRAVYITGTTKSKDLPKTENAAQTTVNVYGSTALYDGFAAKFNMDLGLRRTTYLGGQSNDSTYDIAVHPEEPHDVYVVGSTSYCPIGSYPYIYTGCLPWTDGGGISTFVGSQDAFVVRLNADLTADPAPQATYYGGTGLDFGTALAIHPGTGNVYIAGGRTNEPDPPSTIPTDQYAFVAYFNRALTEYLGDAHIGETAKKMPDRAQDIKIVFGVGIYVSGWTRSSDLIGTEGGILPAFRGGYSDMFVARFHNNLDLDQLTYVGGGGQDENFLKGLAVAEDPATPQEDWHVFIVGTTYGSGLIGVTDSTAFQHEIKGESDIFISRMNADLKPDLIPDIEVQPRELDFGNVALNVNSPAKTVSLENIGGASLTLSSISITGAAAGDYTIDTTAGTSPCGAGFPQDITGSSSCTVSITFRTSVLNEWRKADLVIQTANDPDEPLIRVPLSGYSGPDITVTSMVEFPATQIGSSTQKTFQIKNDGVSDLTVTGIQKSGIAPDTGEDFTLLYDAVSTTCPNPGSGAFILQRGRSCNVAVEFTPSPPSGPQEAIVFVFSDDLDEDPAFITLVGSGVTQLDTDIWSHDLEFRDTPVGGSRNLPWLITNTGSTSLSVSSVTLSDTQNFSIDPDGGAIPCGSPPFSLAKVSSCTMTVTFNPKTADTFDKTITISSNDPDENPLVVHMTGNGVGDADHDGVPDAEESGDANADGTPDAQQPQVAAVRSYDNLHTVVIETDGASLSQVQAVNPPGGSLPGALGDPEFPFGFYHFKVILPSGLDTATVTITLPSGETAETYIKWGPEFDNLEPHYYDFGNQTRYPGAVQITGNVITLHLTDNGPGDHDGLDNGEIYDPGAPARWSTTMGDFDGNDVVDLSDAILCLRVLTRLKTTTKVLKQGDVDADGAVGPPEIIYILQKIGGLR
ncbi:MAG: choice-of-anchor D domain-containing protein [Deltaproteobacteria bacterium]|nr:choice-of-anchor D domain-containing protein [Deltaproteobacteria bacterium]